MAFLILQADEPVQSQEADERSPLQTEVDPVSNQPAPVQEQEPKVSLRTLNITYMVLFYCMYSGA